VIVADYNAIVVEMLENNADPLAAQVYAAIGQSHFVSMSDIYSTGTTIFAGGFLTSFLSKRLKRQEASEQISHSKGAN
jgi:hypothetical protein